MTTSDIKKYMQVWTSDGEHIGDAISLYQRRDNINPQQKYYAAYLETFSFEIGEHYYIPTDFLETAKLENGRLTLSLNRDQVEKNIWHRMPMFIAQNQADKVELPA